MSLNSTLLAGLASGLLFLGTVVEGPSGTTVAESAEPRTVNVLVKLEDLSELGDKPLARAVNAAPGDIVEIRLEQRAMVWTLQEYDKQQFQAIGEPVREKGESKPGSRERMLFKFKVLSPGPLNFDVLYAISKAKNRVTLTVEPKVAT